MNDDKLTDVIIGHDDYEPGPRWTFKPTERLKELAAAARERGDETRAVELTAIAEAFDALILFIMGR